MGSERLLRRSWEGGADTRRALLSPELAEEPGGHVEESAEPFCVTQGLRRPYGGRTGQRYSTVVLVYSACDRVGTR